jgi:hypothetical protein
VCGVGDIQPREGGILVSVARRKGVGGGGYFDDAGAASTHALAFAKVVVIDLVEEEQHEVSVFTRIGVQNDLLFTADNIDLYFIFESLHQPAGII